MTTDTAPAGSRQRFDAEVKLAITTSDRDALDALARRDGSTRAHEVRQAIAWHIRTMSITPMAGLSASEAREALEYLSDIRARLDSAGRQSGDSARTSQDVYGALSTGVSA